MKLSKLAMATYLSVSIGFTPLFSTAASLALTPSEVAAQIRFNEDVIHQKMNQVKALNEALNVVDTSGNSARVRAAYGLLTVAALAGSGVGIVELDLKAETTELEKLKSLNGKAQQFASEAARILKEARNPKYFDIWHMEPAKRTAAIQQLDTLASTVSESDFKAITKIMTNSTDFRAFDGFRQSIWNAPESKITKAMERLHKRTRVITAACASLMAAAVAAMGYTGFQVLQIDKDARVEQHPEIDPAIRTLVAEARSLDGDEKNAWIEAQTLRMTELLSEIIKIEDTNKDLKNIQAGPGEGN